MTHSEVLRSAYDALRIEHEAWVAARDHAQEQLDRISDERARLLSAQVAATKRELDEAKGGAR